MARSEKAARATRNAVYKHEARSKKGQNNAIIRATKVTFLLGQRRKVFFSVEKQSGVFYNHKNNTSFLNVTF